MSTLIFNSGLSSIVRCAYGTVLSEYLQFVWMSVSPLGQKLSAGTMSVSFSMLSSTSQRAWTLLESESLDTEGENVGRLHQLTRNIPWGSAQQCSHYPWPQWCCWENQRPGQSGLAWVQWPCEWQQWPPGPTGEALPQHCACSTSGVNVWWES